MQASLAILAANLFLAPAARVPCPTWEFAPPGTPPPLALERVYESVTMTEPLYLRAFPHGHAVALLEHTDGLHALEADPRSADKQLICAFPGIETFSFAFHPNFARNRYVYVFTNAPSPSGRVDRILRITLTGGARETCDPVATVPVLEWPSDGHNGGDLAFGPDGYLYISAGDGSGDSDQFASGQDITDLRAAILRIDVDHPAGGRAYGIPRDNPFVRQASARPEIFAYGLRNPWRMNFDVTNGQLLVGDVGQDRWESIIRVRRGGNYGWSVFEGGHPFRLRRPAGPTPIDQALYVQPHSQARTIVGGLIYRGLRFPDLVGAYVYGDFSTGRVWALRYHGDRVTWQRELVRSRASLIAIAEAPDHELLLVDFQGGLYTLAPRRGPARRTLPERLSQTGLYASTATQTPAACLFPYQVNAPQWLEGAAQERHLALPGTTTARWNPILQWTFPEATTAVKTIYLPGGRPIETQLITLQEGLWAEYTFAWRDDGSDADLVPQGGWDREIWLGDRKRTWHYARQIECSQCHSRASGEVLGLFTPQVNRPVDSLEQLVVMADRGLIDADLSHTAGGVASLPRFPDPYDTSAPVDVRARAYLHANCADCHVEAGGGNSTMNLHYVLPLALLHLVGVAPEHDTFGLSPVAIVRAGDPEHSVLWQRMARPGYGHMPPLGPQQPDDQAVELIRRWILAGP
jgi:glucose/arabinose dehydrogenase